MKKKDYRMKENKLVPFILCLALLFSAVFFSACEKQTRDAPEEAVFSPPLSAAPTAVFRILSSPTDRVVVYEEEALFSASPIPVNPSKTMIRPHSFR